MVVGDAISRSRDKLASSQLLVRKGIDMPITAFAHNPDNIDDLIAEVGGAPLVIKMVDIYEPGPLTGFSSVPMPSISILTLCPGFR